MSVDLNEPIISQTSKPADWQAHLLVWREIATTHYLIFWEGVLNSSYTHIHIVI
jgi:hypothetical protein